MDADFTLGISRGFMIGSLGCSGSVKITYKETSPKIVIEDSGALLSARFCGGFPLGA